MNVLVTGSSGAVGTAITDGLADEHRLTGLDQTEDPQHGTETVDIRDYEAIRPYFDGQDAVIHAAQNPALNAGTTAVTWSPGLVDNLMMTTNVVRAAIEAELDTIVHCSSNHVVGMYEKSLRPELYAIEHELQLDHHSPARPDSMYAVEKLFEEGLINFVVERHQIHGYSLRIGNVRPRGHDSPYHPAESAVEKGKMERGSEEYQTLVNRLKGMWLSRRDVAHLCDRCLHSSHEDFEIFYGVSDNPRRWFDLSHPRQTIGYDPIDNGEEVPPPEGE